MKGQIRLTATNYNVIFSMQLRRRQRKKATVRGSPFFCFSLQLNKAINLTVFPYAARIFGDTVFHLEKENEFKKALKKRPGLIGIRDPLRDHLYDCFSPAGELYPARRLLQPLYEEIFQFRRYQYGAIGEQDAEEKILFWPKRFRVCADHQRGGGGHISDDDLCSAFGAVKFENN